MAGEMRPSTLVAVGCLVALVSCKSTEDVVVIDLYGPLTEEDEARQFASSSTVYARTFYGANGSLAESRYPNITNFLTVRNYECGPGGGYADPNAYDSFSCFRREQDGTADIFIEDLLEPPNRYSPPIATSYTIQRDGSAIRTSPVYDGGNITDPESGGYTGEIEGLSGTCERGAAFR